MIKSKKDYLEYLIADNGVVMFTVKDFFFPDQIYKFKKLLRRCEYYKNVKNGWLNRIIYIYLKWKLRNISFKLGFSIPENVFGPGLKIPHYGTIVIHHKTRIGANCKIHVCTNIGESGGVEGAPIIGNNVYIGPGVKIYGKIEIASNVAIAANAAVGKSFLNESKVIGGVPAVEIANVDIKRILKDI